MKSQKHLKSIIALTLSASLIGGVGSPAMAEVNHVEKEKNLKIQSEMEGQEPEAGAIQREEAIQRAQELIRIPDGFALQSTNYHSANSREANGTWNIAYILREGRDLIGQITIAIDAKTGELIRYHHYRYNDEGASFPPKVQRDEAVNLAQEFIDKVAPDKSDSVVLDPFESENQLPILDGRENYRLQFVRTHNGIPFPQHYIRLEVNADGEIVNYYREWDDRVTFTESVSTIPQDDAQSLYKEIGADQLEQQYVHPPEAREEIFVAYQWNPLGRSSIPFIDAETGKPLNNRLEEVKPSSLNYEHVSEQSLTPHFSGSSELNEEDAYQHVIKLLNIAESQFQLESSSYSSEEESGRTVWRFNFQPVEQEAGKYHWITVSVDTTTGTIHHYMNEDHTVFQENWDDSEPSLSDEELLKKAKEAFVKFAPTHANDIYYIQDSVEKNENRKTVQLQFTMMRNGIPASRYPTSITLDRTNGNVVSFSLPSLPQGDYPSLEGVIDKEVALNQWLQDAKVHLKYYVYHDWETDETQEAKLVYELQLPQYEEPLFLNAKTGEWHGQHSGEVVQLNRIAPIDIENHWAKEALMLMYEYRAIDTNEEGHLLPDEKVKRGEMIKMLILAMNRGQFRPLYGMERDASFDDVGYRSPYFQYVEAAVDMNILDRDSSNLNPEEFLSREEAAVLIVRALGFDKLAKQEGLFNLHVDDQDEITLTGHVAIALHLEILSAQNGMFVPEREITRAEAATVFQRYLEKRSEVTSSR